MQTSQVRAPPTVIVPPPTVYSQTPQVSSSLIGNVATVPATYIQPQVVEEHPPYTTAVHEYTTVIEEVRHDYRKDITPPHNFPVTTGHQVLTEPVYTSSIVSTSQGTPLNNKMNFLMNMDRLKELVINLLKDSPNQEDRRNLQNYMAYFNSVRNYFTHENEPTIGMINVLKAQCDAYGLPYV